MSSFASVLFDFDLRERLVKENERGLAFYGFFSNLLIWIMKNIYLCIFVILYWFCYPEVQIWNIKFNIS